MKTIYITILILVLACPLSSFAQTESKTVAEAMQSDINSRQKGHLVMARLIKACGLMTDLAQTEDMEYYNKLSNGSLEKLPDFSHYSNTGNLPKHRYIGYTIFCESDSFWENAIGKDAKSITAADVQTYLRGQGLTGYSNTNYTSLDNMLYKFVTYHILPERIRPNRLVIHHNELWYNSTTKQKQASVFEYYTTMGQRRLLKTYEASHTCKGDSNQIYLNRFPVLNNGREGDYTEIACESGKEGILITDTTKYSNACLYSLDGMLAYTSDVEENLGVERLRMDFTSMMPELMTNDIRLSDSTVFCYTGIPTDQNYKYFQNCKVGSNTNLYYLTGKGWNWSNYQGDEFNATGSYDLTFTLPPVPKAGTYEIRIGQSVNQNRGVCLVSFGADPDNLKPVGLPVDLRKGGEYWYISYSSISSDIGFEDDVEGDDMANMEADLKLHHKGYMKAPNSYYSAYYNTTMRKYSSSVLRRIIYTGYLEPDQTYYLRFTNALDNTNTEFYLDYLEYCPESIYNSEEKEEDIW